MFTSVTKGINRQTASETGTAAADPLKTGMIYLGVSILIAAAAAVYGLFSHGVYSYFMTYAFMIPLLGGAVPHLMTAMKVRTKDAVSSGQLQSTLSMEVQLAVIATLTVGSLLKGILDIYGTTNRLLIAYPVIAALILAAALAVVIKNKKIKMQNI